MLIVLMSPIDEDCSKLVITEEMLDAIEAVKGVRDSRLWDPNCKRYMENQLNSKKDVKKSEKS